MSAPHFDAALHPRSGGTGQFVVSARAETGVRLTDTQPAVFGDDLELPPAQLLEELYTAARDLMDEHGLLEWRLGYVDHRGKTLGTTRHVTRTISLSAAHMVAVDGAERRDTVLHEIAHALLPAEEGHGWRWQAKAREVGASPNRTSDVGDAMDASAKIVGTCPMGHTYHRSRMPTRQYACSRPGHPGGQTFEERALTWARNAGDPQLDAAVKAAVRKHPAKEKAAALEVGCRVRLNLHQHRYDGALGVVTKTGRTNAIVKLEGSGLIRVPFSVLETL